MLNFRAGAGTLYHWARILRGARRTAIPVDPMRTRQELMAGYAELDTLVQTLRRDGVAVIPDYWSPERAGQARLEMDRILASYPDVVQVCSGGSDKRVYGVESASGLLMEFHADTFLRRLGELLAGLDIYNFATLGGRIEATQTNTGSGNGWHRDAAGFQFKAILYLTDAAMENGPFEYLVGSHTIRRAVTDTLTAGLTDPEQTRFTDEEIARLTRRGIEQRAFPGRAGTLLLVNTAGIHRGMPLMRGERYALTNYYYHRVHVDEARIRQFSPLVPGTAERVRRDLSLA